MALDIQLQSGIPATDPHASTHQVGGDDAINVGGLPGDLADPQDPKAHKASHQDGGGDEISIAGLSGSPADGLLFVRADKDGDGDFDPLTSTSWDGDAYAAGTGTINWNTVFGVPATAKAVFVRCSFVDETAGAWIGFKAKSTTAQSSLIGRVQVANVYNDIFGVVPIQSNGTSYYEVNSELDAVYLQVVGWYV